MKAFDPIPACFAGVGFLPIPKLERIVSDRLEKFRKATGQEIKFPIDVETAIEVVERIPVQYFDTDDKFGAEVLGAYDFTNKVMHIREHFRSEGRRRFTLAHEYGHFVLHAGFFMQQVFDFFDEDIEGSVQLNRGGYDSRNILEWQANRFASHYLMPTSLMSSIIDPLRRTTDGEDLVHVLAYKADVSIQAARYRLQELGWIP